MKLFTLCAFIVFLASCCDKSECIVGISESVRIELRGFSTGSLEPFKAYLVSKENYKIIDSTSLYENSLSLNTRTFENSNELSNHNIIIRTPNTSDTIYNINYKKVERRGCNDCFLKKDKETHTIVEDFSLQYKGTMYKSLDTLVITP